MIKLLSVLSKAQVQQPKRLGASRPAQPTKPLGPSSRPPEEDTPTPALSRGKWAGPWRSGLRPKGGASRQPRVAARHVCEPGGPTVRESAPARQSQLHYLCAAHLVAGFSEWPSPLPPRSRAGSCTPSLSPPGPSRARAPRPLVLLYVFLEP